MINEMLVSVVVPTYNRKKLLSVAINSILNQTYKHFEIIIVDDCSTDGTKDFVLSYEDDRIKYFRNNTNIYAAESRNVGIKKSNGDFIAFLDDDDEWLPNKLEKQIRLFDNSKVGLVYSSIELFFKKTNIVYNTRPLLRGEVYKNLLIKNYVGATPSAMIRKEALNDILDYKYFDSIFPAREEYDLWIRISKNWEIDYVKDSLVRQYYRNNLKRISTNIDNYINAVNLLNIKYNKEIEEFLSDKEKKDRLSFQQYFLGSQAIKIGNAKLSKKYYWSAFRINKNKKAIISYFLCFLGPRAVIVSRYYFDKIFGR